MTETGNRPRVMLNPSCQYGNQIFDDAGNELYNEGHNLWHVAQAVRKALEAGGRVDVHITRDSEGGESDLDTEAERTNKLGCACLVALHSDASSEPGQPGGGTWTFYTGKEHLSEEELANLPYTLEDSRRLADLVQAEALAAIRTIRPDVQDRGVREHWYRLRMLHAPQCPSCLIEILFHTNPEEREILKDPAFHDLIGKAIAGAILKYLFA